MNETNVNCPECGQLIEAGRPHISRERNGVMVCFVDTASSRMDELERNEIARGSVMGRIAILLFGDENNVTDEQCVDELQNQLAALHEVREYLWPNQDGMPNKHRNCLVAIQAREQLASARITELERRVEELTEAEEAVHNLARHGMCMGPIGRETFVAIANITAPRRPGKLRATEHGLKKANAEVERLKTQLAEREEDRALLDWLEKQKEIHPGGWDGDEYATEWRNPVVEWSIRHPVKHGTYDIPEKLEKLTLRAAIRAARAQPEDGK